MIVMWIRAALLFLLRLVIPPPPDENAVRTIDPNAPCPSCGHRDGKIQAVDIKGKPQVQHTCKVCDAKFYEDPVLTGKPHIKAEPLKE